MSTPLHDMPELRATFETDARGLIRLATEHLAGLNQPAPNYSVAPLLRNTIHSLRGAAAMVGAEPLTALISDYERLLEVADSFKLTAPARAREVHAFLQNQLPRLGESVQDMVEGKVEAARQLYELVHAGVMASWGSYFYAPAAEVPATEKTTSKGGAKAARAGTKTGAGRGGDTDLIAREFLTSLGVGGAAVAAANPPPKTPVPVEQIDPEMLAYFVLETTESLAQIENLALAWEKSPQDAKIAFSVFRLIHTIKGAANSLGLARIGRLLHGLEDLLETQVVDRAYTRVTDLVEVILGLADTVRVLVRETEAGRYEPATMDKVTALTQRIKLLAEIEPAPLRVPELEAPAPLAPPASIMSVPVPVVRLTEAPASQEPLPVRVPVAPVPESVIPPAEPLAAALAAGKTDATERTDAPAHQTIRVDSDRLDLLMNLIGELVISRSRLEKKLADISRLKDEMFFGKTRLFQAITEFQEKYEYSRPAVERNRLARLQSPASPVAPSPNRRGPGIETANLSGFSELEFDQYDEFNILARTLMEIGTDTSEIFAQLNRFFDAFGEETDQFSKITARLQDEITHVRMIPLTLLFQRLKRASRDAARKENKDINFTITDNGARLDKLILDQLYTPLLHLVRNAVSHGVESPAERQAAAKPEAGGIHLRALCESNQIVLEIMDDGRGLNFDAIRATAIRRGLLPPNADSSDESLTPFIFQAGFTTAANVTDVSGRGIGLDVVRQEIARLGGTVHVVSKRGEGCTFVIHLPLTLAINQAMFIHAGDQTCALPLNFVERVQDRQARDITVSGQQELMRTAEGLVPFIRLRRLLNLGEDDGGGAIVLARVADRRLAIGVDRILRKQDIVVKPLGPLLHGHPLFSGATLGGDGQVIMIVDLPRVLEHNQSALYAEGSDFVTPLAPADTGPARPTILVVDDSLSVRKVIEKHLHSLQFRVELAVDGLDALEKLRTAPIALVLTDLEMPRMHGFELIAEMRRHAGTQAIPIVVVTSRDAEKHRRRAAALGANDYIIKPFSRDQLAEHINRHLAKTQAQ